MADADVLLASLNSGEVSRLSLARVDLAKLKVACEVQSNWMPLVLGPCMMRPGLAYIAEVPGDAQGWLGEFYFDEVTKALLVATAAGMQFLIDDAYVSRAAVATAIANGTFAGDISGWADSDEAGATSAYAAVDQMSLTGTGSNYAYRDQQVTVTGGDAGVEHAVRLVVNYGYVSIQIGTAQGDGTYWDLSELLPGTYSLAFLPAGSFWVRIGSNTSYASYIGSITIEGVGPLVLPVPWATPDLGLIRYDQSGDVIFVACGSLANDIGYQQRRIERRSADSRSWAITTYLVDDGPFRLANTSSTTIEPNGSVGTVTLTASRDIFKPGHVGALFRLTQQGQFQSAALAGANQFTGAIRVSGLTADRDIGIVISGTFSASVVLQRSLGAVGNWVDFKNWPAPTTETYNDNLDNQVVFYRLGIESAYTSGTANASLAYSGSIQTGIARVTDVLTAQTATADVLSELTGSVPTNNWSEGEWSGYRGYPSAVALHDGRLFWEPGININGSVSDAFASFDDTVTGDSGPISRVVATGGGDGGRWLLSLQRLILATAAQEISIRASAFDEPLTPTAFVARVCGDRGGARVRPVRIGTVGAYVGRNGMRVHKMIFDAQRADYHSKPFDRLKPEMYAAGVADLAIQRQPDNAQIWAALADGTAVVLTYDEDEDVEAMVPVVTQGSFERVAVLPGTDEDDVYFIVARVINGVTKRFIEKLSKRTECMGGTLNKTVDSHIVYSGAPTVTLTGLGHLEGCAVVVWADGAPVVTVDAPATVSGGAITVPVAVSNAVIGSPYTAQLKTVKLAYAAERGTAVEEQKRVARVGVVMADVGWKGVRVGRDFTHLGGLPATYKGKPLIPIQVLPAYDAVPGSFNGGWDSDARVCIQVQSPYPCTLMGLVLTMGTNEPNAPEPAPRDAG